MSSHPAQRISAMQKRMTFADLIVGDFITAEPDKGKDARWVKVTSLDKYTPRKEGQRTVGFYTPTIEGTGAGHQDWVIDRYPDEEVVVDLTGPARVQVG